MSEAKHWDENSREDLRAAIRSCVMGEVRLAKTDQDDILDFCREVYIADVCPEEELDTFVRFAMEELEKAVAVHEKDQAAWPAETDADSLDKAEAALLERGILLWQASTCCDTCTRAEVSDRIGEIERRHPGTEDKIRGYAFFIDQNMADMLADDIRITVYLGYGWLSAEGKDVDHDTYERNSLGIAKDVCDCLREFGFEPDWDGNLSRKIGITLNWQRRTMLQ